MSLFIELIDVDAKIPTKAYESDAGYDLYSIEYKPLKKGDSAIIKTGIKIDIPKGYYGRVASRSGLAVKHNLEVGAGVIDNGYHGEIMVLIRNHGDNYTINKYDKIAQLILEPYGNFPVNIVASVDNLRQTDRDKSGFGSSGN
jgi:dUTP pyrophosphatase